MDFKTNKPTEQRPNLILNKAYEIECTYIAI